MPKLTFTESEIKTRLTFERNLKPNERRDGRLNVGCAILKNFVDGEDVIEIIIRKKK
jgi:hypothetical protein